MYGTLVFKTDMLKNIIKNTPNKREVSGGDHNASKMYLMNIQKLFNVDIIKKVLTINNKLCYNIILLTKKGDTNECYKWNCLLGKHYSPNTTFDSDGTWSIDVGNLDAD